MRSLCLSPGCLLRRTGSHNAQCDYKAATPLSRTPEERLCVQQLRVNLLYDEAGLLGNFGMHHFKLRVLAREH